ncbi:MAG: hypothetical protein V1790_18670 [Planctomycetota bacterium]
MLRWDLRHRATGVPAMLLVISAIVAWIMLNSWLGTLSGDAWILGLGGYAMIVPLYLWAQRVVTWDGPQECLCGHVLTGHTSGPCPACGAKIPIGCKSCGYDLTGNVSGVCPECGEKIQRR